MRRITRALYKKCFDADEKRPPRLQKFEPFVCWPQDLVRQLENPAVPEGTQNINMSVLHAIISAAPHLVGPKNRHKGSACLPGFLGRKIYKLVKGRGGRYVIEDGRPSWVDGCAIFTTCGIG